jgi:hypothetical protein
MVDRDKSAEQKQPYTTPELRVHGSIESMTKTGLSGVVEAGSSSGSKKKNSLG